MRCNKFFTILAFFSFSFYIAVTTHALTNAEGNKPRQPDKLRQMNGPLIDKLTNDGFDRAYLQKVFSDPRVKFLEKSLAINLINRDIKVDYSHFLNTTSINRAKRFLEKELSFLNKVEKQFKVEKEIVVSILLIESSLGKRTGKNIVFNVFTTLCAAAKPEVLKDTYQGFKKKYPHLTFEEIRKRAYKKSKWAYQELKHLFFIAKREKIDIFLIKGSWAGAFGAAQFLPSSYVRYALDGNNDQKVRLLNRYDSMVSVANYLKENGWKKGLSDERKKVLIRRYNNSTPYIDTVLKLSKKIEG